MTAKQKRALRRILLAAALFLLALAAERLRVPPPWGRLALFAAPYLVVGWDVLRDAARKLVRGQAFDESFLMSAASLAAFAMGEYPEAAAVMLFYQIGELFQSVAVGRARASIASLMELAPESVHLETPEGVAEADPEEVAVGSVIVVRPGERLPLDGVVLSGESSLDASALTGESAPRAAGPGDEVYSGCVNGTGLLRLRTTRAYQDSTVARILELAESAGEKKARLERFITRFARVYTPAVTLSALALAVLPPLLLRQPFGDWLRRACVFLIVSCPCALVISVPLGIFGGVGAASRMGVLVKGGSCLEALADCETMVFDKTGTLTRGEFAVTRLRSAPGVTETELLRLAALAESASTHPIARSVVAACPEPPEPSRLTEVTERPGRGVRALLDGKELLCGSAALLRERGVQPEDADSSGTAVHVALDGRFLGTLLIDDRPKEGAAEALRALKALGLRRTVLLTGDRRENAGRVARALGVDEVHAELLPADKVARLEAILAEESGRGRVAFVGDGVNDAPALMRADVGIAMGALGSDAAIEAADVVLMDDDLRKLAAAVRIGRRTMTIVRQNVAAALGVKFAVLLLGALGLAGMWLAVFADVGVLILAVLNSMRALHLEKKA